MKAAFDALKLAGCQTVYIDGSFVTAKNIPGDFDCCWEPNGVDGTLLDPILLTFRPDTAIQKAKYYGELFPNVVEGNSGSLFLELFQIDRDNGDPKGIVALDLRRMQ